MRILAYAQHLQSYRSLTLESMALAFGVTVEFIDRYVPSPIALSLFHSFMFANHSHRELARFISQGRLNCTIDKVHGVVETNRPTVKISQYETVLRQGDILLNQVQKLSKVLY